MGADQPPETLHSPKAIIFDIGRVIVRIVPERAMETLAPGASHARSAQQLWDTLQQDSRWNDWQEGRMEPREWHEHLTRELDLSLGFEEFCAAWNRTLHPETILKDSFLTRLSERYKLAVLSNTDPLHSALLDAEFAFLRHFPVRIYSCRVRSSKPSPAIYQTVLDAVGITAGEALYIDDIAEYAEAARTMGFDAIVFTNPSQLSAEFIRRGLPAG
jgi:FMN phosphatase YigB (HAD superfamily)